MWLSLALSQSVLALQHSPARLHTGSILQKAELGSVVPFTSMVVLLAWLLEPKELKALKQDPKLEDCERAQNGIHSSPEGWRETQV